MSGGTKSAGGGGGGGGGGGDRICSDTGSRGISRICHILFFFKPLLVIQASSTDM